MPQTSFFNFSSILVDFGRIFHDFERISMDLGIIFEDFGILFYNKNCRSPEPPGTKRTDGKHQEHAGNCRNMQMLNASKNADSKTPIDYLEFVECSQLQQTPSFKHGGGGARAARRIRIRRPRKGRRRVKSSYRLLQTLKASYGPRPTRRI